MFGYDAVFSEDARPLPTVRIEGVRVRVTPTPRPTPRPTQTPTVSEIRQVLGVGYTISSKEYTNGYFGWRFLEPHTPINLRHFSANTHSPVLSVHGDVFIKTMDTGYSYLFINLGPSGNIRFYSKRVNVDLGLPSEVEFVDTRALEHEREERRARREVAEHLARFNMSRQYTSRNFYWYSTEANAIWLPGMARGLEARMPEIIELFGFELPHRIPIWYYSRQDYNRAYPSTITAIADGYSGHTDGSIAKVARPIGSTVSTNAHIDLLAHEAVHVIQWLIPDFNKDIPSWLLEGTATYFERYGYLHFLRHRIADRVRNNRIPALDRLENDDFFWDNANENYGWGASIVQFLTNTWGFEYVVELHRNPNIQQVFGISRREFERQWHQYLRDNFR